jgi:hypothetical protein
LKTPRALPRAEQAAQYLARYAEPEARLAAAVSESYSAALVVPVRGEVSSLFDGFQAALAQAPGPVLFILVVNATDAADVATHADNQRLLEHLAAHYPEKRALTQAGVSAPAVLASAANYDLLWIDRASLGVRLPERQGVGSVRKLGNDLAVALWSRGQIACSRIASSDADVCLPADYFSVLAGDAAESSRSAAWLWPFKHEAGGDPAIDAATVLYEISLRYYVLGMAHAGSCYAYQSIGSTLCVDAAAYLSVRGFPKREAGEDFYLLDKLAKVSALRRLQAAPIHIRARRSERVPFGTGRRSREIAEQTQAGSEFVLYSPRIFLALAAVLRGLDDFAESGRATALKESLDRRVPELAELSCQVLEGLGVFSALASAATEAPRGAVLRRRIHTWFDALRSLRFVHGLRDRGLPSLPWREALSTADFLRSPMGDGSDPQSVCRALSLAEAQLPEAVGPALL